MSNPINEWFSKGDNDLLNVENNLNSVHYPADTVCFHCQQLAEKYLKGFLTYHNIIVEKTHNLLILYKSCIVIDPGFNEIHEDLINLNNYSVSIRYPDYIDEITEEDAQEAYRQAKKIRELILSKVKFES